MERRLVPLTIICAMTAFAVGALAIGLTPQHPQYWSGSVRLVISAGILPMIFAITVRVMPVFSRRDWRSQRLVQCQIALSILGGWLLFAGLLRRESVLQQAAHVLLISSALLFTTNLVLLFRQPPLPNRPAPPLPYPEHVAVDRVARRFTMLSGLYLVIGSGIGVWIAFRPPTSGQRELVWAHSMLVGFFLSMASGICYHVLARWTSNRWRWPRLISFHLVMTLVCLPLMLIALASGKPTLFSIAGPLQAIALLAFLANVVPMARGLPRLSAWSLMLAVLAMGSGVTLGAFFAGHPVVGVHYRAVHAELNLFGWTGLLISGMAYYLVPRMFGHPLKWPRLAAVQVSLLVMGVIAIALSQTWRIERGGADSAIAVAHGVTATSFALLAMILGWTMLATKPGITVSPIVLSRRPVLSATPLARRGN